MIQAIKKAILSWTFSGVTTALTAFISILALGVSFWQGYVSREALKISQEQNVNSTLNEKIDNCISSNNDLKTLIQKIDGLSGRISTLEGWKSGLESRVKVISADQDKLKQNISSQQALTKLNAPERVLGTIRAELTLAREKNKALPESQLVYYRLAVTSLPASLNDYWQTVADLINYQSFINQIHGAAPDPVVISHSCGYFEGNIMNGYEFQKCQVLIDSNYLVNCRFEDSVVSYNGGPIFLRNISFINCRFVLNLPPKATISDSQSRLLQAILNSPQQKQVRFIG